MRDSKAVRATKSDREKGSEKHPALIALGQCVRKARQERGFSQEDFAASVGLDRSYYGGIERGERNVAALNLMRIAATLEVEVGELFPPKRTLVALLALEADTDDEGP